MNRLFGCLFACSRIRVGCVCQYLLMFRTYTSPGTYFMRFGYSQKHLFSTISSNFTTYFLNLTTVTTLDFHLLASETRFSVKRRKNFFIFLECFAKTLYIFITVQP